jgi:hypothetical protein
LVASGSRRAAVLPRVQPIDTEHPKEAAMHTSLMHRTMSLSFAAIVTVMTLAGVDTLATQQPSAAQMAQALSSARA